MVKEQKKELTPSEKIEAYLNSSKRYIKEIKEGKKPVNTEVAKKEVVKKKAVIQQKKKYSYFLKVASFIVCIIGFGSLLATIFVPNVGAVIMAIFESLDFLEKFRGGNALDPSDYVMFLK